MEIDTKASLLRRIPAVDEILRRAEFAPLLAKFQRALVLRALDDVLEAIRALARAGRSPPSDTGGRFAVPPEAVEQAIASLVRPSLARVVNATGVVLHTNLGRAPLASAAIAQGVLASTGYATLEYDIAARKRGSRHTHVAGLLCELTGGEAAMAVNNNAAAVLLVLSALANEREVIVSRGELIEIGGSFRIPDVMRVSGARLIEVGTTNKTHAHDYAAALGDATGLILKVHRSNFDVVGFTSEVDVAALATLASPRQVPVAVDLGSGSLVDLASCGLAGEMTLQATLRAGADIVTASGDKLLGGPQAGLIVGRRALVDACKRHPLARAVRCDKFTLAALEATLRLYRDGDPWTSIPTLAALSAPASTLEHRAHALAAALNGLAIPGLAASVRATFSRVGGGAFPTARLPSHAVALTSARHSAREIDAHLRAAPMPVIARITKGALLLDVRTVAESEVPAILASVATLLKESETAKA